MKKDMVDVSYCGLEGVEVLVSKGYGAGWSTWNDPQLAYDKRVVKLFKQYGPNINSRQADEIINAIHAMGYDKPYMGGWKNIQIEVVPCAKFWRINEYDGAETIEILNTSKWHLFA